MARKSRGLLKGNRSITGNSIRKPKSLKPQKARSLIRRYHTLLKDKEIILKQLKPLVEGLDNKNYVECLRETQPLLFWKYNSELKLFIESWTGKQANEPMNKDVLQDTNEMVAMLGKIDGEIKCRGGIEAYQVALTDGQDSTRGGDSSKRLIQWLESNTQWQKKDTIMSALEIGCLSANNCISTCGMFEVTRIDLNSQNERLILQQDFMDRPLPTSSKEKFDMISCSLVLNYVPDHNVRGQMLWRFTQFLNEPKNGFYSKVFIVLPLPCVTNSRYFNNARFIDIMTHLGFCEEEYYEAKKVAYWLFSWKGSKSMKKVAECAFKKTEINSGLSRNNFCITL